jgi:hypothetical protein
MWRSRAVWSPYFTITAAVMPTWSAGRAPVAAPLRCQVGDQAITVAAIDGADELDDPP